MVGKGRGLTVGKVKSKGERERNGLDWGKREGSVKGGGRVKS